MNPHTETAAQAAARIAKEDKERKDQGLPAYTAEERAQVEADLAAAKAAADAKKSH